MTVDIRKEIEKKFPTFKKQPTLLKKSVLNMAKKLIHEDTINTFLKDNSHLKGIEFVDAVLDYFNFDYGYKAKELENIPPSGRVVIIANHPLGALDAMSILKLVSTVRKDVKIIANDYLASIETIDNLILYIDNFNKRQRKADIQKVYEALNNEEAVIIFPAGEVSRFSPKGVIDGKWHKGFINFAKNTNSPILPILIEAQNSKTFYTVSALNKTFSTILLSNEMFKQQSKGLNIRIGEMIGSEHTVPQSIERSMLPSLYKKHLYSLNKKGVKYFITQKAIAHPEDRKELKKALKNATMLGHTADNKKIYLYEYEADSIILKEIGRLREVSFRAVGEGVNQNRDFDKFDKYYQHIIVWDDEDLEIVGAYRVGNSNHIMKEYGVKGFYTSTLYEFHESMHAYLKDSIELGRSFVQPKYWGTRALDYLWYGIGGYLNHHPEVKYLFGPVSISHTYPALAKDLLIFFYRHYFGTQERLMSPSLQYFYSDDEVLNLSDAFVLNDYKEDFKRLKSNLSSMGVSVPTLYKQYSEVCEEGGVKFVEFNVDEDFSNAVDGFVIVDVRKFKDKTRKRYIESHNKNDDA
jgi:putative hemolysin